MTFRSKAWRFVVGGILVGSAAVIALYWEGFASLVSVWSTSAAYRFLFLVPVLSLYFFWLRAPDISAMSPRPTGLGLIYAAPFGALSLIAQATQLSIAAQVAAVGTLQAVFLTVLGWRICRQLMFPLLMLWLMVPVGDLLTPALIELTTGLTTGGLRLIGMPAVADGNMLVAGGARYAIIQECSGLDFLLGNLLISMVFANLIYRGIGKKCVYVLASLPVAILANNLRTISVIFITANGIDLAADHNAYGWFVLLFVMMLQMAIGLRYRDEPEPPPDAVAIRLEASPATASLVAALLGIVLLAALAPVYARFALEPASGPVPVRLCLPASMYPAREPRDEPGSWRPEFPYAGARVHRLLEIENRTVDFFVAYYWQQGPGSKLIGWGNRLYDGRHWRYMASDNYTVDVAGTPMRVARERLAGASGQRRQLWYWYWADGQFSDRPWQVKLLQAKAVLLGGDQRSAVIAFSTEESAAAGDSSADTRTLQVALSQRTAISDMLRKAARGDTPGRACP